MRLRSRKRAKQERKYVVTRKEFIEQERKKNKYEKIFCIFCDKEISEVPDLHHKYGRDGDKLLKIDDWAIAHNKCHVHEYHSLGYRKIPWWKEYIKRIKKIDHRLYAKELRKMEKSTN